MTVVINMHKTSFIFITRHDYEGEMLVLRIHTPSSKVLPCIFLIQFKRTWYTSCPSVSRCKLNSGVVVPLRMGILVWYSDSEALAQLRRNQAMTWVVGRAISLSNGRWGRVWEACFNQILFLLCATSEA